MNYIMKWFFKAITALFGQVFSFVSVMSFDLFSNEIIQAVFILFKTIGLALYGIAALTLILNTMIKMSDGDKVKFSELFVKLVFGGLTWQYGVDLLIAFYRLILDYASQLLFAIAGMSNISIPLDFTIIFKDNMISDLMMIILMIVSLYYIFKTLLNLMERFWQFFAILCMLYPYLTTYILGNDEAIGSWFKQLVAVGLTQIFQALLITLGMNLFITTSSPSMFFIAIGAIIAASKVEQYLDKFGLSAGGKAGGVIRNGLSTMFYAKSFMGK